MFGRHGVCFGTPRLAIRYGSAEILCDASGSPSERRNPLLIPKNLSWHQGGFVHHTLAGASPEGSATHSLLCLLPVFRTLMRSSVVPLLLYRVGAVVVVVVVVVVDLEFAGVLERSLDGLPVGSLF